MSKRSRITSSLAAGLVRPTAGVRGPEIIAEKRPFAHSHVSHSKGLRTEGAPMQRLFSRYNRSEDCVLRIVRARCAARAAIATVIFILGRPGLCRGCCQFD